MFNKIPYFRFWCQKVLPTVYDDSLSYYELLCKVVAKLNEVIDSTNSVTDAFNELVEYVNHYLDSQNFQELVNNKLDEMAQDGTLSNLINVTIFGDLNDKVDKNTRDIDSLEDRVETLEGDVGDIVEQLGDIGKDMTVAFLSAPDLSTEDPDRGYSLCVVLHNENICITYDLGNDTNANTLVNYLIANNIHKIDAAIISHYHSDHASLGRVNALLGSGIEIVKWYLPHGNINWNRYIGTNYSALETSIKNAITNAGGEYVTPTSEGYLVSLGDAQIRFYNLSATYYEDYYSYMLDEDMNTTTHTNYNNFSMIASIDCGGSRCVLTGDIEKPAERNNAKNIVGADIMLIPHHALNLSEDPTFVDSITAKISVAAAYGVARFRRLTIATTPVAYHAGLVGTALSTVNGKPVICNMGTNGVFAYSNAVGTTITNAGLGDIIPPNSDLDDYVQVGKQFYIQNADVGATIANIPFTTSHSAGRLYVIPTNQNTNPETGSMVQLYIAYFSYAQPEVAIRYMFEGVWRPWKSIIFNPITNQ